MAKRQSETTATETQTTRRAKYGVNVAIGIAAAVAIAVLLNVIAYRYLDTVRYDATHSRLYSLSEQTRKLLGNLKHPYQIVTLIVESNEHFDNAKDLIKEYEHYADKVTVEHMDPRASRGHAFFTSLQERYEKQLSPMRDAIERGRASLAETRRRIGSCAEDLKRMLNNDQLSAEQQKFLGLVSNFLARFSRQTEPVDAVVNEQLEAPMPDLEALVSTLRSPLENLAGALDESIENLDKWAGDGDTPASVKDQALALSASFTKLRDEVMAAIDALKADEKSDDYDNVRSQLEAPNTVAILGADQVRVIPLNDMFRRPDPDQMATAEPGQLIDYAFIGEEKITGALVGMELESKPLVVFVNARQEPALGPRGSYGQVAERLEAMNFDVQEWSTVPRPNQFGGGPPMPPGPPPEPSEGQRAIWIVPPIPGPNPMMGPQQQMGGQQVPDTIRQQLEKGNAALVMFAPNPMAFGAPDPMTEIVQDWGIRPQTDRRILREMVLPDRRTAPMPYMQISEWPGETAISAALAGMPGVFPMACPMELDATEGKSFKHWVLAQATGQRLWAQTDMHNRNPKFDPANAADAFTLAAAAEKDGTRLVVVTDPMWATNEVTTNADQYLRAPNLAQVMGAFYPANAEMFVNSVLWLAELDQLIARSARTQDIRRIAPLGNVEQVAIWWLLLAGLPVVALGAGIGVWLVRRRV